MTWITTATGHRVDYALVGPDDIDIEDIATALSRECRYAGHCKHFYSVAQHSVLVSRLVPEELALEGLLHDAVKAYLKDLPLPLKALLPDYREMEARFDMAIRKRFGLPETPSLEIKQADLVLLATERRDLLPDKIDPWPCISGIETMPKRIWPLSPEMAREQFLDRYKRLTKEQQESA
jgi:hypothetical protein